MGRNRFGAVALVAVCLLALAGCAAGANDLARADPETDVGFFFGLWHGFISPVTFVISLFEPDVGIYELRNNGHWYDLGFVLGASAIFSGAGGSASAGRRRRRN